MDTPTAEGTWQRACSVEALEEGAPSGMKLRGIPIALYKVGGEVFATHDVCTHAYALLSNGFLEGHTIECPLHGALYDVRDGKCLAVGACDLKTYPVQVQDGADNVLVPAGEAEG
jgi:nitrite reductase/ring-hydroxylating ferredoxin subunit